MTKTLFVDPAELSKPSEIVFENIPANSYKKTVTEARPDFADAELVRIYRDMTILRAFEDMLNKIKTQGNYNGIETTYPGPAHLSLGQEAGAVGQAYLLGTSDIIFGNHRSHSEILAKSLSAIEKLDAGTLMTIMETFQDGKILKTLDTIYTAKDVKDLAAHFVLYGALCEIFARDNGFHRGMGGSMHAFFLPFGVYPNNAIVGGSAPIAAGAALYKRVNEKPGLVVCNIGDGSLGCGPVLEVLNFSAMGQFHTLWEDKKPGGLPIIFNVWNNAYGMGGQTNGETMAYDMLARIGAGVAPGQMSAERVWGHDPLAVIDCYRRKKALVEQGGGPVFLDVLTYRLSGHSTSDQNAYRSKEELDAWAAVDPIKAFREELVNAEVASDAYFEEMWAGTTERMTRICGWAADPAISPYADFKKDYHIIERTMFSNGRAPKLADGEPKFLADPDSCSRVRQVAEKNRAAFDGEGKPVSKLKMLNIRDAIFEPVFDKFKEDPTIIAYGEDVRDWGGAFAVYRGMNEVVPYTRLFNAPISEAAIVGSSVGYGLMGGRVISELMYCDFIGRAGDEIFNQLSKWQAMSAGILKMPVVLRVSVGAKYGAQHSQDWTALCAHIPGLKVCFPATPWEAKGLMTAALNGTDPVVFFESQRIYDAGERFRPGGVPKEAYEISIGDTNTVRRGADITILTIGATLYKAVDAAGILSKEYGVEAEIINLHSLVPLDYTKILESVDKTGKVVLASDACARGSFINDVARNITELAFDRLDGPPVVVGAQNWITPPFEYDEFFFPQADWILDAIHEKLLPLKGYQPKTGVFTAVDQLRRAKAGV
ncbi:MAG: dehydrogenase [Clostridiales Family XIII bacterium]|jgi:2-oxoisovalerate dehydrogenase E1 component|nr:dehydrogenase [Clostridiales Family XIII bacterium]